MKKAQSTTTTSPKIRVSLRRHVNQGTRPGRDATRRRVPASQRSVSFYQPKQLDLRTKTTRRHSLLGLIPSSERESTSFLSAFPKQSIFEQQIDCIHTYSWPGKTTDHEHGRTPFLQSTPYHSSDPCQDDQQTNGGGNPSETGYIFNKESR
jgi:hypothetical protein